MDEAVEPQEAFDEIGRFVLGAQPLSAVLDQVASLAQAVIPGADEVSITLLRDRHPATVAFTGDLANVLDERQYDSGYGPCLDAAQLGGVILIEDTAADERYPDFAAQAARQGVQRTMSVALPVRDRVVGALNVYGRHDLEFDDAAQDLGRSFAGYAAIALANAALHESTVELTLQLEQALTSRAVIDQAKGALMTLRGISADDAFEILRQVSQDTNRKLRDVASDVLARVSQEGGTGGTAARDRSDGRGPGSQKHTT